MLNGIGLQNPGVRTVIKKYAPTGATWQPLVIVNIAGETMEEFGDFAERLEGVEGFAGIEVNVSCPNVRAGGAVFGADAQAVADVTAAVRRATTLPLIVKLSPNSGDARPTALAAASYGADAVSLINTITGMGIDTHRRRPTLANGTGGLFCPPRTPIPFPIAHARLPPLHPCHIQPPL